jgi:hypothetical protein
MRVIAIAAIIAVLGAVGASYVLNSDIQVPAYKAFATSGARVGDPGDNLVGRDWPAVAKADHKG